MIGTISFLWIWIQNSLTTLFCLKLDIYLHFLFFPQVSVYTSPVKNPSASELKLAWENASISLLEYFKM